MRRVYAPVRQEKTAYARLFEEREREREREREKKGG